MPLRVSVVIPIKDEEESLPALLESLRAQTRPPDEIVIVDGGSTDRSPEILARAAAEDPRLVVVRVERAYPGTGRNIGVGRASHDVIAFTDAGIRPAEDWLAALLKPMEDDPSVEVVYGHYGPIVDSEFVACAELVYLAPRKTRPEGRLRAPSIACAALTRRVFEAAGGFPDFRAAEDRIFMEAVEKSGAKIAYAPAAKIFWRIPGDLTGTLRRFRTLARHDLIAGRGADWHYRVFAYLAAAGLMPPLAPPAYLYRVVKNMWRRAERPSLSLFRPGRVARCAAITLATDAAVVLGTWDYLRQDVLGG
jgi:glycosyltransferase involved in cell wall biosynthesis